MCYLILYIYDNSVIRPSDNRHRSECKTSIIRKQDTADKVPRNPIEGGHINIYLRTRI